MPDEDQEMITIEFRGEEERAAWDIIMKDLQRPEMQEEMKSLLQENGDPISVDQMAAVMFLEWRKRKQSAAAIEREKAIAVTLEWIEQPQNAKYANNKNEMASCIVDTLIRLENKSPEKFQKIQDEVWRIHAANKQQ